MTYNTNTPDLGRELGWDDIISEESSSPRLLEPGDYPFTVTRVERKRFAGSAKMCACNMVVLHLDIDGVDVTHNLHLNSKVEWKISEFGLAIGQKQPDTPFRPDWAAAVGATGLCTVGNRSWEAKDGSLRYANEVKKFLPLDPARPAAAAPAPSPAQQPSAWQAAPQAQQQTMPGYQTHATPWQGGKF